MECLNRCWFHKLNRISDRHSRTPWGSLLSSRVQPALAGCIQDEQSTRRIHGRFSLTQRLPSRFVANQTICAVQTGSTERIGCCSLRTFGFPEIYPNATSRGSIESSMWLNCQEQPTERSAYSNAILAPFPKRLRGDLGQHFVRID